jgi:hypothetical protein
LARAWSNNAPARKKIKHRFTPTKPRREFSEHSFISAIQRPKVRASLEIRPFLGHRSKICSQTISFQSLTDDIGINAKIGANEFLKRGWQVKQAEL